ncbi:MAG: hypothetical protein HY290_13970 [Planctomycetia bacterium]|nr:hypothetical protein [Planctomycetia bacterium]
MMCRAQLQMTLGLFYGSCGTHDGPAKLAQNLVAGLTRIGVDIRANEIGEMNGCLQSWAPEYQRLPHHTLMGPNLVVVPADDASLWQRHHSFVVPSLWVKRLYERYDLTQGRKLLVVSAGVDTDVFTGEKQVTRDGFIYFKHRSEGELSIVEAAMRRRKISYSVIRYGHYRECDLIAVAQSSRFCILLTGTESDGIAVKEILATNTPCFACNTSIWRYGSYPECPAASVPWFDATCGIVVEHFSDDAFDRFHGQIHLYEPRKYVLEHHTLELAARRYLNAVHEAHGNPVS